jgi:hypothetical protein
MASSADAAPVAARATAAAALLIALFIRILLVGGCGAIFRRPDRGVSNQDDGVYGVFSGNQYAWWDYDAA